MFVNMAVRSRDTRYNKRRYKRINASQTLCVLYLDKSNLPLSAFSIIGTVCARVWFL